jgi:hypothetical protein
MGVCPEADPLARVYSSSRGWREVAMPPVTLRVFSDYV